MLQWSLLPKRKFGCLDNSAILTHCGGDFATKTTKVSTSDNKLSLNRG